MTRKFPRNIYWYADEVRGFRERYYNAEGIEADERVVPPALVTSVFFVGVMLRRLCWMLTIIGIAAVAAILTK